MAENPTPEENFKNLQEIVEVLRYLILRDQGKLRRYTEAQRQAIATVDALVKQYKLPPP